MEAEEELHSIWEKKPQNCVARTIISTDKSVSQDRMRKSCPDMSKLTSQSNKLVAPVAKR